MSLDVEKPKCAVSTSTCDKGQSVSEDSVRAVARCLKIINSVFSGFPISCLLKTYASPVSLLLLCGCQFELGISRG